MYFSVWVYYNIMSGEKCFVAYLWKVLIAYGNFRLHLAA